MTGVRPASAEVTAGRTGGPPGSVRRSVLSAARTLLVVGLVIAAYAFAPWDREVDRSAVVRLVLWLGVVLAALLVQIRAVMRSPHPWLRAVEGAVLAVTLLLVPLAAAYTSMSAADPATFTQPLSRIDAFYFTVTVFATVGFGDIAPVSEQARVLVTVQMLADLVLLGMIVKLLIGTAQRRRESLGPRRRRGDDGD